MLLNLVYFCLTFLFSILFICAFAVLCKYLSIFTICIFTYLYYFYIFIIHKIFFSEMIRNKTVKKLIPLIYMPLCFQQHIHLELQRIRTSDVMNRNIWQYIFWEQLQHSYSIVIKAKCLCVLLAALSLVPSTALYSTDTE